MKIGLVAGEASGDILGAGLMAALTARNPDITFLGIGGERMISAGLNSFYPQERLAVMGFIEPLGRLPELLRMRKRLGSMLIEQRCDIFIGIDAPDFNLSLEKRLKQAGIKTVHYVSPSVWAWRQGRIKTIKLACDHMLTLFPFEAAIYQEHHIPVSVVGHTLADKLPLEASTTALSALRQQHNLDEKQTVIALLPGSRMSEVTKLAPLFLQAARLLRKTNIDRQFIIPAATSKLKKIIEAIAKDFSDITPIITDGESHAVMAGSDAIILASGTATLEAMLLKKPMVVSYKMHPLSFAIYKKLVKVKYVALPNLLADEQLVPELLQKEATPEKIANALEAQLSEQKDATVERFTDIHRSIKLNANERAATAVLAQVNADEATA